MAAEAQTAVAQLLEPHGVLAWLGTYLVHSTLLLGAAWIASRCLRGRSLPVEERLWKAALVGGLLTATIQTGLAALPAPVAQPGDLLPGDAAPAPPAATPAVLPAAWTAPAPAAGDGAGVAPDPRLRELGAVLPGWQRLALAGWLGGGLLLTGGLALAWLRLRLRLRGREDVGSGPAGLLLHRLVDRTGTRRPVRLTGTRSLPVPVALGVGEREICLPERALRELDERRQEGLLAHELAHLERRDPAWHLAALALQGIFFFQPLNRLARRRLEEIAELQCDAWAVRATGDRVGLARCLTEVASWLVAKRGALPAPGMARSRGRLGTRVRRILDAGGEERPRRWLAAAAAAALVAGALLVPGLAPETFADPETPAAEPATPATPPAEADETAEREERGESSAEARPETGADADLDGERDLDASHVPDPEEISRLVDAAMAAARASLPDPAEMAEIQRQAREAVREAMEARHEAMEAHREAMEEVRRALEEVELEGLTEESALTAAEAARLREEVAREMAAAQREVARALEAARPELEAIQRMNREIEVDLEAELARVHEELERTEREVRRDLEREVHVEREEVRREMEQALGEARRQLEVHRRQLEEQHRQLDRQRRELEERQGEREPPAREHRLEP